MDLPTLEGLFHAAQKAKAPLVPMHTMRGVPELAAVRQAVRAGDDRRPADELQPEDATSGARPARTSTAAARRSPASRPGSASTPSTGCTGSSATCSPRCRGERGRRPTRTIPACASQAAFVLTMQNGGVAAVTLDYLRPEAAPTHGDERLRIAGSEGVIETALVERRVTLSTADRPPRTLPLEPAGRHLHAVPPRPCAARRRRRSRCTRPAASRRSPSRRSRPPRRGRSSRSATRPTGRVERLSVKGLILPCGPAQFPSPTLSRLGGSHSVPRAAILPWSSSVGLPSRAAPVQRAPPLQSLTSPS